MLTLKLTYLGVFQIEVNGQPITNFRTEKTAALLAYLLLEARSPLPRHHFTELLWSGYEKKAAQTSLRVALAHLRQILAPAEPIKATYKHIHFDDTDVSIWSDVGVLIEAVNAQREQVAEQQLTEGLSLCRGEFLEGWELLDSVPFQEWLQQRRTYYTTLATDLRHRLAPFLTKMSRPQRHNLPRRVTPLFGHRASLAQLRTLLFDPQHRLITLIGEGGIGKTRLALAAAWSLIEATASGQPQPFADGLWFVPLNDLAPTVDLPDRLASAIGIACGFSFATTHSLSAQLLVWLRTKSLLLILDSFEHLITASSWLNSVMEAAPRVKFLVTSRQRLDLQTTVVFPVHELAIPAPNQAFTVDELLTYPSIQLFVERGQRVRAGFRLHQDNAAAVLQICRQMVGLPLGIELAATLLLLYSPSQIVEQLAVGALTVRSEWLDWPTRHQTLEEVLRASWRLLSQDEAALLAHLAIIKGNFTQEDAITIGAAQPATLFSLVDKSLLRQTVEEASFTLHDLVRDYALRQLKQQPACEKIARRRHAVYYLAMVEAEEPTLVHSLVAQQRQLSTLDNIRAAWVWAVEQGEVALWTKASDGIIWFYRMVGFSHEATIVLQNAVTVLRTYLETTPGNEQYWPIVARLLAGIAEFSPYSDAEQLLQDALQWSERSNDPLSRSIVYHTMSSQACTRGDFTAMLTYAQQALTWAKQSGQVQAQLASLHSLATAYYFQDDFSRVLAVIDEIWDKIKQTTNRNLESPILISLGHFYTDTDNFGKALHCLRKAFLIAWRLRPIAIHEAHLRLGKLYNELGFFSTAQALYQHSLAYYTQTQYFYMQTLIQHGLGTIDYATGNCFGARHYFNKALQLTRQHTIPYWEYVVLIDLGYTIVDLDGDQAATCFEQAIRLGEPWQKYSTLARAYVGLAKVALGHNQPQQATAAVERALFYWNKGRTSHAEPRHFYWHCYEVLHALGNPLSQTILQQGCTLLLKTADTLTDPVLRRSFLENVPINRALLTSVAAGQQCTVVKPGSVTAQSAEQTESVLAT